MDRILLTVVALIAAAGLAGAQGRTAVSRAQAPPPSAPATAMPISPMMPGVGGGQRWISPTPVPPVMGAPPRMPPAGLVMPQSRADIWHPGTPPRSSVLTPSPYPGSSSFYPGVAVPRGTLITPSIHPGRGSPRRVAPVGPSSAVAGVIPDPAATEPAVAMPAEPMRSKIIDVPPSASGSSGDAIAPPGRIAVPRPDRALTIVGPGAGSIQAQRPPASPNDRQAVPRPAPAGSSRQAIGRSAGPAIGGQAVPRSSVAPAPGQRNDWRSRDHRDHGRFVFRPGLYTYPRYYYPRYSYPYGYGAFGLGYFYYDPYQWYAPQQLYWLGPNYYGHGAFFDVGELRLRVTPGEAQVYVDGVYVGMAADFTDTLRALKLEIGTYHIDLVLPGYQTLSFDVQITPGRTVTYDGQLTAEP